jgi:UDP-galactopyranose mutase
MHREIMQLINNFVNWIKSQNNVFTVLHHLKYQLQKAVNKLLNPLVPELYATQNVKELRT